MPPGHHFAAGHPPPASGGPSLAPAEGLLMAGEGGVLFSLRAARRQMLACSLPVIKRPPARLSPALCCAAKRRHAASCCGPWRAPHRRRRRCRARSGRSPRASAAVAGVWGGCDGACCRTPRAGGGRLTVPHRGRAPLDALPAWHWGVPLPCERWRCCSPAFGVRRGRASPAAGRWLRLSPAVPHSWIGEVRAACATQGLCKLLGTALAHRAVPYRAVQLARTPGHCPLCRAVPLHSRPWCQHLPSAVGGIFAIGKSLCSPLDPSLVCQPPQPLFLGCAISFLLPAWHMSCPG